MTKSIPNYICIACGKGFSTASSGRRHVATVESGNGFIVTEAQYRIYILTGQIPLPVPKMPLFPKPSQNKKATLEEMAHEEFLRGFYRRMGEKAYEAVEKNQDTVLVRNMKLRRTIDKILRELNASGTPS